MVKCRLAAFGAAVFGASLLIAGAASAAVTIGFGEPSDGAFPDPYGESGFSFTPVRSTSGQCASGRCLAFNTNDTTTMTRDGGIFDLISLYVDTQGRPSELKIVSDTGVERTYQVGGTAPTTLVFAGTFNGVSSLTFSDSLRGNVRIDDIVATPLPAAVLFLGAGLAGLGVMRRRQQMAA